jgi:NTE family protein
VADTTPARRPIGLVLSGGGARCFAQLGAMRAAEEHAFSIAAIAANSSAALLGALAAAGHDTHAIEGIFRRADIASLIDLDGTTGLSGHDGVVALLEGHVPATFEELELPLALPVVDIERAELLILKEGPLLPAVCASNAFPGVFTPVWYRGRHLLDGGILNNFPVDVIRSMTTRPVLAVDVRPSPRRPLDLDTDAPESLVGKVGAFFADGASTTFDILMQAYSITQDRLVRMVATLQPPDVWLTPGLPHDLDIQDLGRMDEAIEIGYRSACEAIAEGAWEALAGANDD